MRTTRSFLALVALVATTAAIGAGCSYRNPDVNRVVDPYWEKTYFNPNDVWYMRASVIDTPVNSGPWTNIGDGHWLVVERLKWEVTESHLIGYRDFEATPGAEEATYEGNDGLYKGAVVAMFAIDDHFDIRRTYDALSGVEGNVIEENREKPWYERQFMRVDWGSNLAAAPQGNFFQAEATGTEVVEHNDPADPKRWRFEDDYFEVTGRVLMSPEVFNFFGFFDMPYSFDGAYQRIDLRHSFVKMDPNDDYIPTDMPPSVVLEDADGNEVRGDDGYPVRIPIWDRFGLYSTLGRTTWDPNRGRVDSGRLYRATLFPIWERYKNADGSEMPVEDRTPKPIVYYTNAEHPDQLMDASINRVGSQWNKAFKEVVFHAQPSKWDTNSDGYAQEEELSEVPDMFIVRENDCNIDNVIEVFNALPTESMKTLITAAAPSVTFELNPGMTYLETIRDRIAEANDPENDAPFTARQNLETQAKKDLMRFCSAMEYYTSPAVAEVEVEQFQWQRLGDLRYSMFNLIMQDHQAGWLGYGPMLADPVTGKTLAGSASIAVSALDNSAARADQMVQAMNGQLPLGDLVYGFDIQRYIAEKLAKSDVLTTTGPNSAVRDMVEGRFDALRQANAQKGRDGILNEVSPDAYESRIERLKGTALEDKLIGAQDELLSVFEPAVGEQYAGLSEEELIKERASPLRNRQLMGWENTEQKIWNMGAMTMDPPEYADQFIVGLALKYRDMEPRQRYEQIREDIYVAVQLHEVGHNVGLFHNFEASTDALNYGPIFWDLQELDPDLDTAIATVTDPDLIPLLDTCRAEAARLNEQSGSQDYQLTTQACLRQTETVYSSIMDYHANWNADFNGLGMYDKAAIKFAYAGLLEVFDDDTLVVNPETTDMKRWLFLNDWRDIPSAFARDKEALHRRKYIKYEWDAVSTQMEPPANTVPYRFCPGGWYGQTPTCLTFDYGPDTRSNAALLETRYAQNFFFNHFNRDRLWEWGNNTIFGVVNSDDRSLWDYSQKMRWYYFYKATDPEFTGSYAEEDFLATTIQGLNHFSHQMSHPGTGPMVSVPKYFVNYYLKDGVDEDRLGPSDIMIPYNDLGQCSAFAVAEGNGIQPTSAKPGYKLGYVPLGDGRPFFIGLTEDYEDYFVRYVGSYWSKQQVISRLTNNFAWFPRTDINVDPRFFDVGWYRLFPEQVGDMIAKLSTENYADLGMLIDDDGNLIQRDIIAMDENADYVTPDYTGMGRVLPSISFNHQFFAMAFAHIGMSSTFDGQTDLLKSYKVAVEGGDDDFGTFDMVDPSMVAEFTHPISGQRYRALRNGQFAVAAEMIDRANVYKERYETLQACVDDPAVAAATPYCHCTNTIDYRPLTNPPVASCTTNAQCGAGGQCGHPDGGQFDNQCVGRFCVDPYLKVPGTIECSLYDLENRTESALETMEDQLDVIDDFRGWNRFMSEW